MKRLLALIMTLMMCICVFSACSEKKEGSVPSSPSAASDEGQIETVISECSEKMFNGDKTALEYVKSGTDVYSSVESVITAFETNREMFASLGSEMGIDEEHYADIEKIATDAMKKIFSVAGMEVKGVKVNGNKATVDYVISMPAVGNLASAFNADAMDAVVAEMYSEDALISMQEDLEGMSEQEQQEYISELMIDTFAAIIDIGVEVCTSEVVEEEGTFELEKTDGKWIIVADE